MLDSDGYRPNIGIIVANQNAQVLWARRVGGHDAWQFPQGGIDGIETTEQALFRELEEEVGLIESQVRVLAATDDWLYYQIPKKFRRYNSEPGFKGQKQKWYLLQLQCADDEVCVSAGDKPEFDHWRWVSYWYPAGQVVDFKRDVYRQALKELAPHLPVAGLDPC